jgi:predicted ATP-grasp superfamily ATP-dependent carboligase
MLGTREADSGAAAPEIKAQCPRVVGQRGTDRSEWDIHRRSLSERTHIEPDKQGVQGIMSPSALTPPTDYEGLVGDELAPVTPLTTIGDPQALVLTGEGTSDLAGVPRPDHESPTAPPPALLTDATWYGTLAAARDLGSRGVPVIAGYDTATAPVRWSRHTRSAVRCPAIGEVDRFVEWLLEFGTRNPGCVLYPTSDDVAFLIALHRESLEPLYRLFSPRVQALVEVLDKSRLSQACRNAGLLTPQTWVPRDEAELQYVLPELPMPVIVKPRAHFLAVRSSKGERVDRPEDLVDAWRSVRDAMEFHRDATAVAPQLNLPIVQALHSVSERIYTVDGFADASGNIVGALACVKSLQLPRRSGAGVCFEPAELDPQILAGLQRLCHDTGFVGVFDVEFAIDGGDKLLIDFNPRFYNHMAFEIDRGLPLPWLAYCAALGPDAQHRSLEDIHLRPASHGGIYVHRLPMHLMMIAQRFSGRMSRAEIRAWRRWIRDRNHGLTDPAFSSRDIVPALIDFAQLIRNPRSLLRNAGR